MSVQTELTRILTARNILRTKSVALGIGLETDSITDLAEKYDEIVDQGTPNASVKEGETYTISPGYYHGGVVSGIKGGGNYSLQAKTVTPTKSEQIVDEDSGYYGLSSVTVNPIPGAYQDVTSVTAVAGDVLATKVIVDSKGAVITGTMPNNGKVTKTLNTTTTSYTVPAGYHNGQGTVSISTESKTVTPSESSQDISPASGKVLSKVTVNAIPDKYKDASATTVTADTLLSGTTAIGWSSAASKAVEVTGTMTDNGAVSQTLNTTTTSYTVPAGYHNGSGKVSITTETKSATPTESSQTISPSTGKVLSSVTVNAIPAKYKDATNVTVASGDLLSGKTAIGWNSSTSKAVSVTGTMTNNGAVTQSLNTATTSYTIPAGYHNGSGSVSITTETKTATPTEESQTISPSTGKVLSSVTVNAIPAKYKDATDVTVTAGTLLSGTTAIGWDATNKKAVSVTGTMTNNGKVTKTLNAGGSYTIPAGYHNGQGTVTANSLASQTGVDSGKTAVTAATMLTGYQGWVNGSKVSGTMPNRGTLNATITGLSEDDTDYTLSAGYYAGGTVSLTTDIENALAAI